MRSLVARFQPRSEVAGPAHHTAANDTSTVTLTHNGKSQRLRLVNGNKISLNAVKEAFNLRSVQLDGQLEPADQLGFTVAEFAPGQTVEVTGERVAELEALQAEIAGLRAELAALQDVRADLRNAASLSRSFTTMTESYDGLRSLMTAPAGSSEDLELIKRLLAELLMGARGSPDFTQTSQDGYTFDTYWDGRLLAKDIISRHTQAKKNSSETSGKRSHHHRHHNEEDAEEIMTSFHAS